MLWESKIRNHFLLFAASQSALIMQGNVAAMEAPGKGTCQAGVREQELDRALETTLSNPSLCTQGTERASDLLRVTQ